MPGWSTSLLPLQNLIPATFHVTAITLISMSMVQVPWFIISGGVCTPFLTLGEFFSFGYLDGYRHNQDYVCINNKIVNLMRTIILMCFMAIIFSLAGFFINIFGPRSSVYRFIHRYALASTCSVLWIMVIIAISYYVAVLLEETLQFSYPRTNTTVSYGFGFYFMVVAGGVMLLGNFATIILMYTIASNYRGDHRCLINRYSECIEIYNNNSNPPAYSIAPPPYTP